MTPGVGAAQPACGMNRAFGGTAAWERLENRLSAVWPSRVVDLLMLSFPTLTLVSYIVIVEHAGVF
jgi:hypothetical protein